jgi:hypothetical protein
MVQECTQGTRFHKNKDMKKCPLSVSITYVIKQAACTTKWGTKSPFLCMYIHNKCVTSKCFSVTHHCTISILSTSTLKLFQSGSCAIIYEPNTQLTKIIELEFSFGIKLTQKLYTVNCGGPAIHLTKADNVRQLGQCWKTST